ncbi:hypothetical protein CONLIGDRAFT_419035 [Coniochaeta ligniaria NRRL 30616]|uniref:Uncharacterized protein n=1 Tax=Coniochaeta ligniaria NRRL 30616 TaxID=1408157 RepID=A0A1J7JBU7_9PEZI|nr:hypothetical protein CONLIGDRAFT_419035 [Coniochaeta ligniaria NRRL 30616]
MVQGGAVAPTFFSYSAPKDLLVSSYYIIYMGTTFYVNHLLCLSFLSDHPSYYHSQTHLTRYIVYIICNPSASAIYVVHLSRPMYLYTSGLIKQPEAGPSHRINLPQRSSRESMPAVPWLKPSVQV